MIFPQQSFNANPPVSSVQWALLHPMAGLQALTQHHHPSVTGATCAKARFLVCYFRERENANTKKRLVIMFTQIFREPCPMLRPNQARPLTSGGWKLLSLCVHVYVFVLILNKIPRMRCNRTLIFT